MMDDAAKMRAMHRALGRLRGGSKDGRPLRADNITIEIGEAELEEDESRRAETGEAAGVGAAFGDSDEVERRRRARQAGY